MLLARTVIADFSPYQEGNFVHVVNGLGDDLVYGLPQ